MIFLKHLGIDVAFKIYVNQRHKGWDSYFEVNILKLPLRYHYLALNNIFTWIALENDIYNT